VVSSISHNRVFTGAVFFEIEGQDRRFYHLAVPADRIRSDPNHGEPGRFGLDAIVFERVQSHHPVWAAVQPGQLRAECRFAIEKRLYFQHRHRVASVGNSSLSLAERTSA
jgi:hypothetical protein